MKYRKMLSAIFLSGTLLMAGALAGCGGQGQATPQGQAMKVSTFKPFRSNTPIMREYTGSVIAEQQVPIRAKVSGTVIEKYVSGGEKVIQGQPLYRIDTRNYQSMVASAEAGAAQARATYENARRDLARYESLLASDAIPRQVYDTQKASVASYKAAWEAAQAQLQLAQNNLEDTVVTAPFSGTLSMDDLNVGSFVMAGQTPLVTISSSDPLYVQFSISESEYLKMAREGGGFEKMQSGVKLRLSDGSIYGEVGKIVQVNSGLQGGQITMKASYPNPRGELIPGMYATVVSDTEVSKDSILIPTKALIPLLNKNMVDVVIDGKVAQKSVEVAGTYGVYSIITSGLDVTDDIIVEGQGKVRVGQDVKGETITREQLETSISEGFQNQVSKTKA